jgi:formate C-acetyltransferase
MTAREIVRSRLGEQDRRTFPVWMLLKARSFAETEGLPMTIRRAHALNAVLEGCELVAFPGELLMGSSLGRHTTDGDAAELDRARRVLESVGDRNFITHADHAAPDYAGLLQDGLPGLLERANESLARHATGAQLSTLGSPRAFLESVIIALEGVQQHLRRWSLTAQRMDAPELGCILSELADRPPHTFHEAAQLVLLVHTVFQMDNRYAMALGRLDQHLYPFYRRDIEMGRLSPERAQEILDHLFAKLADRGDIQNVCVGGLTPHGADATNEVSYMCVEAVKRIAQPGGNLTARLHAHTPHRFIRACADCMRGGSGFPAVYNDEIEVPALIAQGYAPEDARDYCFVGCIEAFIPGKQAPWADSRFNLLRCVDLALRERQAALRQAQQPAKGDAWETFWSSFSGQIRVGVEKHVAAISEMERQADARADELTSPLLSALTSDCIERALDVNAGGARYPSNHGIAGMGIGSTADALMAIKRMVFDTGVYSLDGLVAMLDRNFAGLERDRRRLLEEAPKYGNDDGEVDGLAADVAELFCREVLRHRTPSGGRFWGLMAANVQNVAAGLEVGATADGRKAGEPVSDAASPSFGRDRHGPTAVVRSIAKLDYGLAPGGNVVNMKLHPSAVEGERGLEALAALIRTCFDLGGVQLQFNTVGREVLLDAMEHPERYADLVVRVSGFSAYFTRLDPAVQRDVLARSEHRALG